MTGLRRSALLAACVVLLAGCAAEQTGALGPAAIRTPLPQRDPPRQSERDHADLVAAFGGEYPAPRTKALLDEVVARLVASRRESGPGYAVTLLDSPTVNAFALPSGRLYVTRGMMALANDTSEVAAVIAHEMAHVARRHADERGEFEARALLVGRVEADVLGNPSAGAALRERSRRSLAGFSRAQELEADALGVAALAAAGYDALGAARFLRALARNAGPPGAAAGDTAAPDMLATHPATAERIALVERAARRAGATGPVPDERARYLAAIDGLAFGDNPADGLVRGRRFMHPRLGIAFEAPPGFALENTPRAVLGATADGSARLLFDAVEASADRPLGDVITASWSDAIEPGSLETRILGPVEAATAASQGGEWVFRLAALRVAGGTYRLILAARRDEAARLGAFEATLASVAAPAPEESATLRVQRLAVVTAEPGATWASLAAGMTGEAPRARFLALNGEDGDRPPRPGAAYKVVVD